MKTTPVRYRCRYPARVISGLFVLMSYTEYQAVLPGPAQNLETNWQPFFGESAGNRNRGHTSDVRWAGIPAIIQPAIPVGVVDTSSSLSPTLTFSAPNLQGSNGVVGVTRKSTSRITLSHSCLEQPPHLVGLDEVTCQHKLFAEIRCANLWTELFAIAP